MTIPTMKKVGYSPEYAAAIESCASSGGAIMPPIMGAAAFVMASFLNVSYLSIVVAAVIPAILYYWGIYVQADAYANRANLQGEAKENIPSIIKTLKSGWYYIFAFITLFYFLATLHVESWAPFYSSIVLIILSFIQKESRLNKTRLLNLISEVTINLIEIITLVAAVGLIVGSLSATGVALAFSRELVALIGKSPMLILLSGAVTSFILGMGMTATACYIFLAIVMAPALTSLGFDPLAAHLFVLYWGNISYITPPVALAVFTASNIANSDVMKTGWIAVRIGIVAYIVPFMFVYNPALIGHGSFFEVAVCFVMAILGILFVGGSLEGYIPWLGFIKDMKLRIAAFVSGILMVTPETYTDIIGILISVIIAVIMMKNKRRQVKTSAI